MNMKLAILLAIGMVLLATPSQAIYKKLFGDSFSGYGAGVPYDKYRLPGYGLGGNGMSSYGYGGYGGYGGRYDCNYLNGYGGYQGGYGGYPGGYGGYPGGYNGYLGGGYLRGLSGQLGGYLGGSGGYLGIGQDPYKLSVRR